eukprot:TRINITY_DN6826_c0_g1_i1.p1 TRINITY_DN6826_c0_g1~~TRINITY_DN6826_c0_g1_i1.p1  ORF type:complete len:768 (+),score=56.39 TRINITY_DN6826_c0_g1_i1:338-2641(+)
MAIVNDRITISFTLSVCLLACVASLSVQLRTVPGPFFQLGSNSSITLYLSDVPSTYHNVSNWNVYFDLCVSEASQCEIRPEKFAEILRCSKTNSLLYHSPETIFVCKFDTDIEIMEQELLGYLSYQLRVSINVDQETAVSFLPLYLHPREWTFTVNIDNQYGDFLVGPYVRGDIFLSQPARSITNNMSRWQYELRLSAQCQSGDDVDTDFIQRLSSIANATHYGMSFQLSRTTITRPCQVFFLASLPSGVAISRIPLPLWDIGLHIVSPGISSRQTVFMSDTRLEPVHWFVPFQTLPDPLATTSAWTFTLIPGSPGGCPVAGKRIIPSAFMIYSNISLEATIPLGDFTPADLNDCIVAAESYHPFSLPGKVIIPGMWLGLTPSVRLWNDTRLPQLANMQHVVLEAIIDNDIDVSTSWHLRADGIYPWCQCSLPSRIFAIRLYDSINVWKLSFQVPDVAGCSLSLVVEKLGVIHGLPVEVKSSPLSLGSVGGSVPSNAPSGSSISFSIRSWSNYKPQYWRSVSSRVKDHVSSWIVSIFNNVPDLGYVNLYSDIVIEFSEETDVAIKFVSNDAVAACMIRKQNCANQTAVQLWGTPWVTEYAITPLAFSFWCQKHEAQISRCIPSGPSRSWLPFHWFNLVIIFASIFIVVIATLIWRSRPVQRWLDVHVWLLNPDHLHSDTHAAQEYEPVNEIELKEVDMELEGGTEECPVCLDDIADAECEPCKHRFCQKCITQLKGRCAVCRSPFASALVFRLGPSVDSSEVSLPNS